MPVNVSAKVGDRYARLMCESLLSNDLVLRGLLPPGLGQVVRRGVNADGIPVYFHSLEGTFRQEALAVVYASRRVAGVGLIDDGGERPLQLVFNIAPTVPPGPGETETGVRLTWFQARAEARRRVRIRRAGWADRWLEKTLAAWWVQFINPTTRVLGQRRVVEAGDITVEDFYAEDWTYEGIPGQPPTAGQASAEVPPTLFYPSV